MIKTASTRNVLIIGGGITGLSAAYFIQQKARATGTPITFTLIESESRLGGKIATEKVDDFIVEGGPDCFIRQKPWAAALCRQLGLGEDLIGTNDARRKVFVINRRRLTPLPDGVMLIIPTRIMPFVTSRLISWPGKIRMGMDFLIPRRKDDADESVGAFVRRRLGQEALEKIAEPMMSGIHVSDPETQSLLGTFPRFRDMEKKYGSLVRGMLAQRRAAASARSMAPDEKPNTLFVTLKGGLGEMVQTLGDALTDGQVVTGVNAERLEQLSDGGYRVVGQDGTVYQGDAVVLATPSYVSGGLVQPWDRRLGEMLKDIRYVSTATVSLGFGPLNINHELNGFGYVTPRKEGRQVSACTWTSTKFNCRAPKGSALLRCFLGGPGHESLVDLPDEELVRLARQDIGEMMGVHAEPLFTRVFRWHKANPQYDVGHLERVSEMRGLAAVHPGLFLAGSAYDGVGVPDCVHHGEQAAVAAMAYLNV